MKGSSLFSLAGIAGAPDFQILPEFFYYLLLKVPLRGLYNCHRIKFLSGRGRFLKIECLHKKELIKMKQHKFWAWASVFCFAMVFYTGYKHK